MKALARWTNGLLPAALLMAMASAGSAQPTDTAPADDGPPPLKKEELEQLLAPLALYPDSLVSQMLMASTYPIEVVQAERWLRQNKNLKGDALTTALEKETWDSSVKSLVNFPDVLAMMSDKLDWTTKLGDAFLAQQQDVMGAIQGLRSKAKSEGYLETTKEQTVVVQQEAEKQVIVIEAADPEVIYVPTYNPAYVYGVWPYPAYPPYYYYPPGYVATAAVSFGVGFACGAAWGYAWGNCNWGHGDVDIDIDRNTRINNQINRSRYKNEIGSRNRNLNNGRGAWQHDANHRRGASYRDSGTARRYGGVSSTDAARARDSYRGRAEAGRRDIARGGADQFRGGASPGAASRDRGGASNRSPSGERPTPTQQRSPSSDRSRQAQSTNRGGAVDVRKGQEARGSSQRGQASRSRAPSSGGASRGGMSRGGGGRGGGRR